MQITGQNITNLSILQILEGLKIAAPKNSFAASLLSGHNKYGSFSPKQFPYAHKMALEALGMAVKVESKSVDIDAAKIVALFVSAQANKIKFPKIKLNTENGEKLKFSLAGPNSKYRGQIMVTDGLPFGQNKWYGRIENNLFYPSRQFQDNNDVISMIKSFAENPAGVAKAYGIRTGNCCFCARDLTDATSVKVGYGKICADHYNLPWE